MKISHAWLQKLIYLPESPELVSHMLTGLGLEVEAIETIEKVKGNLEGMVIGQVLTCEKHPDADRLRVTTVDVGGAEPLHIVCGAPNVAAGQKVIVATVGAILYPVEGESFAIKKSKIRGQLSEGMICAEDEIGLGKGHDGIMVLDTTLANGTPAAQYLNLEPALVYEIGLTPNRADAASHLGTARDLKALLDRPIILPDIFDFQSLNGLGPIAIDLEAKEACRRYAGLYISGVEVKSSPDWLQDALRSIGLNPINNLVDITNYVLHELGQPLHAFDADTLTDRKLKVRLAKEGEKFTTLDKVERTLSAEDLVIADGKRAVALAGVFGGIDSGISENTKNIVLESACFNPAFVRKSSQRHGLKTDASFRFERGTDPNMVLTALSRAALLIAELAGGKLEFLPIDLYPQPIQNKKFSVKWRNVNRLIGVELPRDLVIGILNRLDIKTEPIAEYGHEGFEEEFEVEVPAYRVEVTREADIVEEILRVYGIDNIAIDDALSTDFISGRKESKAEKLKVRASQLLADQGFVEIVTNSLTHPSFTADLPEFSAESNVEILNRLSEELSVMRQTLLFTGLEAMAYNINRRQNNLRLFDFGKVYTKKTEGYEEGYRLALYWTGLVNEPSWETGSQKSEFYHLQKSVQNVLTRLGFGPVQWKEEIPSYLNYGQSIWLKNKQVGVIGLVKPELAKRKEVKQPIFFAELDWDLMLRQGQLKTTVKEVSKFPEVRRDLSVVVDKSLTFSLIEAHVRQVNKQLIRQISVFDVYEGDKIEQGKKAYALNIVLQDTEKTLTDQVIDKTMEQIILKLEKDVGAFIRR